MRTHRTPLPSQPRRVSWVSQIRYGEHLGRAVRNKPNQLPRARADKKQPNNHHHQQTVFPRLLYILSLILPIELGILWFLDQRGSLQLPSVLCRVAPTGSSSAVVVGFSQLTIDVKGCRSRRGAGGHGPPRILQIS